MGKYVATVGMVMVLTSQLLAQPAVSVSSGVANQYVAFGNGGVLYSKPVSQSGLNISFGNGVYADFWGSKSLSGDSWGSNSGDEIDYGAGWSGKIGHEFSLNIGFTYFDEPMAMTFGPGDVWYTHAKVSHDLAICGLGDVTLFGVYENYTTVAGTSYEGGNLWSLGMSKSLSHKSLSVSTTGVLVYDEGTFGNDHGLLAKAGLEFDWKVSNHLTVVLPQVNLYVPWTVSDSRETEIVAYVGVSIH